MAYSDKVEEITRKVFDLYRKHGEGDYIGEKVSQIEHATQCAMLAEKEGCSHEVSFLVAFCIVVLSVSFTYVKPCFLIDTLPYCTSNFYHIIVPLTWSYKEQGTFSYLLNTSTFRFKMSPQA